MKEKEYIDRATYRRIKAMSREEMSKVICNLYDDAYEECKAKVQPDYEKIRNEVLKIHGIGDVKADQIVEIIKQCFENK